MRRLLQQLQPPGPRVLGLCPCRAFALHVYLQYAGDSAAKFYSLEQGEGAAENTIVTTFGRAGTAGQSSTSTYASPAAALAFLRKTEAAKRKKGYSTAAAAPTADAPAAGAPAAPAAFPRVLAADESVAVPSSSSAATYRVKCVSVGADGAPEELSCTCVGYAQRRKARGAASTCRHIALVQGEAAEAARLAAAAAAPPPPPELHSAAIAPLIALAHAWAPAVDPAGLLLSEKLDGVRALWHEGRLWSRAGHALHAPPFFTAALPARCTLDGELHMGRGRFSDTVTVARGSGAGAAGERWRGVQYAVFDAPLAGGGFAARLAAAGAALAEGRRAAAASSSGAPAESFAAILPHAPCGGAEDLALQLKEVLEAGGEGLMLRRPEALFSAWPVRRRLQQWRARAQPPATDPLLCPHPPPLPWRPQAPGARTTCSRSRSLQTTRRW